VATEPIHARPVLVASGLTKHFPVHRGRWSVGPRRFVHAVEDVRLELRPREIVALVGESGSGKSTVARMLALLERPLSGQILFEGERIGSRRAAGVRAYRKQVQIVFQDPFASLNPVHRVRYHLERPLLIHGQARGKDVVAEVARLLERVNLTPAEQFVEKFPHELSGGQRQRVAIARALAVRPRVLLADEPVSMLDVSIRLGVLNLLRRLAREERLAILYITHDIASARYFADSIGVMYAGRLIEEGPAEQLTQSPAHPYTELLLAAAPDPERASSEVIRLPQRETEAPSLISPPAGCRFHPRCPYAVSICSERVPPPFPIDEKRWSACWRHADHLPAVPAPMGTRSSRRSTSPSKEES
jgi:peptide/nickel transport system ATP-binding protein